MQNNKKDKIKSSVVTKQKITPVGDRVLIEELEEISENTTAAGIILPDNTGEKDETKKGKVIAVGAGELIDGKLRTPPVSVGDIVLYSWGDKIKIDGTEYIIVGSGNIQAIIN